LIFSGYWNNQTCPEAALDPGGGRPRGSKDRLPRRPRRANKENFDMPRGGARVGSGRPYGSKDRLPRTPHHSSFNKKNFNRVKKMVDASVESEYIYTNKDKVFEGNSLEFIQKVYKCEHMPVRIRLYAATKAAEFEPLLADNALVDAFFANAKIMGEIEGNAAERYRQNDAQLREWILEGRMSEETALMVRRLIVTEAHAEPWEPMPPPPPDAPLLIPYQPPLPDPSNSTSDGDSHAPAAAPSILDAEPPRPPSPWELPPRPPAGYVVLYAAPFQRFWVGAHYEADERGELLVEEDAVDAIDALVCSGCRRRRH
jgi:hypothetical protein